MKNQIFIQARMDSSRFPGKILKKIHDKSILELIVERCKNIENMNKIILVTGQFDKNKQLITESEKLKIEHFCGSEQNILDRMYEASLVFKPDNIIHLTGDNPLIDFNLINKGMKIFLKGNYDVLSINRYQTYPKGLNFAIFSNKVLTKEWKNNLNNYTTKKDFKNTFLSVGRLLAENTSYHHYDLKHDGDLSNLRFTLDYPEDYEFITKIYDYLDDLKNNFGLEDILELLSNKPDLINIKKNM